MEKKKFTLKDYQAILFDFDGVLAESTNIKTEAFAYLFEKFGEEIVKKVVDHHIKNGGISRYKKIKYYYEQYLNRKITDEEINELAKIFSNFVVEKVIDSEWVSGVKDFLNKSYGNIDLYVVSGTPQKELEIINEKRKMLNFFNGVYGTPETKPDIINRLIMEHSYDPQKVLYIGDSLSDYKDAKEAGVKFLGRVPRGEQSIFPDNVEYISDFNDI